jgi:N-acetylmuramoyl-L-alanine amidase
MSYTINESLSDSEWTAPINVPAVFGVPRRIESITIHHWGSFGQTHDGVVDFFVNRNPNTSAHFVVSDGRIHCLVSPANAAWAAGNAYGNATSIHIEARPEMSPGDLKTVAWLVNWLRKHYGANLPLKAHREWSPTACPGIWNLAEVDRQARALNVAPAPKPVAKPAPKPAPKPVAKPAPKPATPAGLHWIVEKGDTLGEIANHYGVNLSVLMKHNKITNPGIIHVGQRISIPGPLAWIVDPGDTLGKIAAHYGMDVKVLAAKNGIKNVNAIHVGQTIKVL